MLPDDLNQSILESAPDAMVIVDGEGIIRFTNRQVSALFGYETTELLGQPVEALLPERFRDRHVGHRLHFGGAMRARPMGSGLDLYGCRRDGSEFPAEISLSPIEGTGRTLVAAAIRDVSDRKRIEADLIKAREAAEAANRAKSRFLAAASHDLRQPLQTLSMLNGTLRRAVKAPAAADALAQQALAIGAMSKLLNSLLDISKLESGAIRPELADFEVAALFEELRAEFAGLARSKGLELRVEAPPGCAYSDPSLVGQILKNLLSNAIKYTRQGWVQIRCLREQSLVRIEVLDTGVGIPPDKVSRIFDEFYQIDVPANELREGYGLGLSIVDRLVRLLGLELEVQSQPGRGSRFALALPAGTGAPSQLRQMAGERETWQLHTAGAAVLLVEDDAGVRNATRVLLQSEGYDVTAVAATAEALRIAGAGRELPDILITDYHLGSTETGIDVVAALRRLYGQQIPAIVITGDTSSAVRRTDGDPRLRLLRKPVDADQLLVVVRDMLGRG